MAGRTVAKMEGGFTIVELIVTIAIAVVLLALSVPAVTVWLPNYYLRNAVPKQRPFEPTVTMHWFSTPGMAPTAL
jgi:prepilin-type N-terminal cleavage/methylation domain-containing protein